MDSPTGQPSIQKFSSFREMLDLEYLTSFFGVIKIIQMVIDLVAFICASAKGNMSGGVVSACVWIQFVSMISFLLTLSMFLLYFFKFSRTCPTSVPLTFTEFVMSAMMTVLYITSGITAASFIMYAKYIIENMAAATFFTWIAVMLYGTESVSIFMSWRQSQEGPYFSRSTDSAA